MVKEADWVSIEDPEEVSTKKEIEKEGKKKTL